MSELLELAEQCERATGPDRELDLAVWKSVDPQGFSVWEYGQRGLLNREWDEPRRQVTLNARGKIAAPSYTGSLDAAMRLVPEGMGYGVADPKNGVRPSGLIFNRTGLEIEQRAVTPALALCAAALRARAETAAKSTLADAAK